MVKAPHLTRRLKTCHLEKDKLRTSKHITGCDCSHSRFPTFCWLQRCSHTYNSLNFLWVLTEDCLLTLLLKALCMLSSPLNNPLLPLHRHDLIHEKTLKIFDIKAPGRDYKNQFNSSQRSDFCIRYITTCSSAPPLAKHTKCSFFTLSSLKHKVLRRKTTFLYIYKGPLIN